MFPRKYRWRLSVQSTQSCITWCAEKQYEHHSMLPQRGNITSIFWCSRRRNMNSVFWCSRHRAASPGVGRAPPQPASPRARPMWSSTWTSTQRAAWRWCTSPTPSHSAGSPSSLSVTSAGALCLSPSSRGKMRNETQETARNETQEPARTPRTPKTAENRRGKEGKQRKALWRGVL